MKTTASTPPSSTVLSAVPNVEVAQSLTASGVRSIAAPPTATTGDAAGTVNPARSWPTPIAAAAASRPHAAPHRKGNPVLGVMQIWSVAIRRRYARARSRALTALHGHATGLVQPP